jgi:hypothetical protein
MDCGFCDYVSETKEQLKTHVLLRHPEKANSDDYESEVSKGSLRGKCRADKGEQFGYR